MLKNFLKNIFSFRACQETIDPRKENTVLLYTADGKFRGSFVNIKREIERAGQQDDAIYFRSLPPERSNEHIAIRYPSEDALGFELSRVIEGSIKALRQNHALKAVQDHEVPTLGQWRDWEQALHTVVADQLLEINGFHYRTSKTNGIPNGSKKTQYLNDISVDIAGTRDPRTPGANYYKYVCNCETLGITMGVATQTVANRLLGDRSGDYFYTIASSNYRVGQEERVEHGMLVSAKDVEMPDKSVKTVAHFVDPSGYSLKKRDIYVQPDQTYTLDQILRGARYIAQDNDGFACFYDLSLPLPVESFVPAPKKPAPIP